MQRLIRHPSKPLDRAIAEEWRLSPGVTIEWRSPLANDEHAEYRDHAFLQRLGLERVASDLRSFWPERRPQWDGLALTSDEKVLLIEAKAHVGELASSCAAGPECRLIIERSLADAKQHYGAPADADWTSRFYQYANRLAHLKFLRDRGIEAHLVIVYFINDAEMRGPESLADWAPVLDECCDRLGLERERGISAVHSLYVDLRGIGVLESAG